MVNNNLTKPQTKANLSSLRVLNASEAQVADAPAGIDAVDLQLGKLKGGVEGLGADLDDNGVDGQRHPLDYFLSKSIFTGERQRGWRHSKTNSRCSSTILLFLYSTKKQSFNITT